MVKVDVSQEKSAQVGHRQSSGRQLGAELAQGGRRAGVDQSRAALTLQQAGGNIVALALKLHINAGRVGSYGFHWVGLTGLIDAQVFAHHHRAVVHCFDFAQ
jgi:hypothetical protein